MKIRVTSRVVQREDGAQMCPDCGSVLSDLRSMEMHGMFFAFVEHCFHNWPTNHSFQPDSVEHLRAWLLAQAGHREPRHIFRFETRREMQIAKGVLGEEMRADRARGVYGWVVPDDGGLTIVRPASISIYGKRAITQAKFNEVAEAVFIVALDAAGIDFDAWKSSHRKAS